MPASQINHQSKVEDLAFTTKRFEAISSTGVSNGSAYWSQNGARSFARCLVLQQFMFYRRRIRIDLVVRLSTPLRPDIFCHYPGAGESSIPALCKKGTFSESGGYSECLIHTHSKIRPGFPRCVSKLQASVTGVELQRAVGMRQADFKKCTSLELVHVTVALSGKFRAQG